MLVDKDIVIIKITELERDLAEVVVYIKPLGITDTMIMNIKTQEVIYNVS